jgi:E1A/CREB-binding protein
LLASITSEGSQSGKGAAPSVKGSSSRSKPLKGKRAGPATGSPTEEAFRRLGDAIQGMREDFIVVHLQEPCSFCREYMSGGMRYYHPAPPQKVVIKSERTFDGISLDKPGLDANRTVSYTRFALCSKCYSAEIAGQGKGLPPGMQLNELLPAPNPIIPQCVDTVPETENEFFDTRTAFLSLCQGNHYQFDSLRRAKHSSMMVLYHLQGPPCMLAETQ